MSLTKHLSIIVLLPFSILAFSCSSDDTEDETQTFVPAGMKLIPSAGKSIQMGSESGFSDEQPVHTVSFTKDFWMDSTEITQREYDDLMSAHYPGYTTPTWNNPYGVGDRIPAYHLYWGDAVLFCNARSAAEGFDSVYSYSAINGIPGNLCELVDISADFARNGYRLPTEAEWEFACRGDTDTDLYWGKDYDPYPATPGDSAEIGNYAVWYANSFELGGDDAAFGANPVASKLPNGYGLYDIAGNLYEWCHDWYGEYSPDAATDPTGPDSGDWHSLRGGSWGSDVRYLRSTNRTFTVPDYIYYFIGFRTVTSTR